MLECINAAETWTAAPYVQEILQRVDQFSTIFQPSLWICPHLVTVQLLGLHEPLGFVLVGAFVTVRRVDPRSLLCIKQTNTQTSIIQNSLAGFPTFLTAPDSREMFSALMRPNAAKTN